MVANFACERAHGGIARQWFRRGPVLALLPLPGKRVSMVWSTGEDEAARLMALEPRALAGEVAAAAGGANVIPSRVRLSLDVRAPDTERLEALIRAVGFEPAYRVEPALFTGRARSALGDEIAARGIDVVELPSGAGHDAGILASAGVDSGMLFVRSLNGGVSHSPDEHSSPEDVELAVEVLTGALQRVVGPGR